jgi:hypothetical protein
VPTLDYKRHLGSTSSGKRQVVIPSFHTGALGFVPGCEVTSGLSHSADRSASCEIYVTPFELGNLDPFRLVCTFSDARGVVKRLLDAIWALGINVLTGETCTIEGSALHYCEFLLDWQTSDSRKLTDPRPSDLRIYQPLCERLPVESARYLCFFKSIQSYCADVIHYDDTARGPLPAIFMQPLIAQRSRDQKTERIGKQQSAERSRRQTARRRKRSDPFSATLTLDATHLTEVRRRGLWPKNTNPVYLLSSDPSTRALRIHFPSRAVAGRLLHFGLEHEDLPGALSTIATLLADAEFNIVQSLLRKRTRERSTWEVLALYEGQNAVPYEEATRRLTDRQSQRQVDWAAEALREAMGGGDRTHCKYYNIKLGSPLYPKRNMVRSRTLVTGRSPAQEPDRPIPPLDHLEKFAVGDPESEATSRGHRDARAEREIRERLTTTILNRRRAPEPRLFLSYSGSGAEHARCLKEQLESVEFKVVDYPKPSGDLILEEAQRLIALCDFFLGLWTPDTDNTERPAQAVAIYGPSPWLPVELGVALSLPGSSGNVNWGASTNLPERVKMRIGKDRGHWEIEDVPTQFERLTSLRIVNWCENEWSRKYDWGRLELAEGSSV